MESQDFARFVIGARHDRKLSQAALGELAGVPQSHIAKIELGADVRLSTARRVLAALGLEWALRQSARDLFENPPPGSKLAAAAAFGVDLGQLYARYRMSPLERLEQAEADNHGLSELIG